MRVNKKQRAHFRGKLLAIRREILGDVEQNMRQSKEVGDDGTQDIADMAAGTYERMILMDLGGKERERLRMVERALEKVNGDEYGKCEECGDDIPVKRLEVVPFALYCVSCLSQMEKREKMA